MRNNLIAVVFAAVFGFAGAANAQQCDVFTDVLASATYCPAVQWLKNRQVTTGCSAGMYCPSANVTRAQMALFMNRLGNALSPEILYQFGHPGAFAVLNVAPFGVHCVTTDSTSTIGTLAAPLDHPTAAVISATFSGLADNTIAWKSWVAYSTDGGTTWAQVPTSNAHRASAGAGEWSEITNIAVMDLPPGLAYRFSIVVARDDLTTTGNFTDSRCQVVATIHNQNGVAPPY
jgi:hypothetical protein